MKRALLVLAVPAMLAGLLFAQPAQPAPKAKAEEPKTEIGKSMQKMNAALRNLRSQAADAALNRQSVEAVATIRKEALAARALVPVKAADVPAAERAKFMADYNKGIDQLVALLDRIEAAFKASDNATAATLVGEIGGIQKASHKSFKK